MRLKKIIAVLGATVAFAIVATIFFVVNFNKLDISAASSGFALFGDNQINAVEKAPKSLDFQVFLDGEPSREFETLEEAVLFAKKYKNASIKEKSKTAWLWDSYKAFSFLEENGTLTDFDTFKDAAIFAKKKNDTFIYFRKNNNIIWAKNIKLNSSHKIDVDLVLQLPELPRGCEVTSLAMLIDYNGENSNKMRLAEEIKKDETPLTFQDGKMFWGNPNVGFVGNMHSRTQAPGFGVYHKPIAELLDTYFPRATMDLTGIELSDLLKLVQADSPVWVITNTSYKKLQESAFVSWNTKSGVFRTTYSEHSVLVTGFDSEFVYFNDPLDKANKAPIEDFKEAFVQMGSQAVAVSK